MSDKWYRTADVLPKAHELCVVHSTYYHHDLRDITGKDNGPTAMAYYLPVYGGWVCAHIPRRVSFHPDYWKPFNEKSLERLRLRDRRLKRCP